MVARKIPSNAEIVADIIKHTDEAGVPPSMRDLAERYDVHHNAVAEALTRLEGDGLIERRVLGRGRLRPIKVTRAGKTVARQLNVETT